MPKPYEAVNDRRRFKNSLGLSGRQWTKLRKQVARAERCKLRGYQSGNPCPRCGAPQPDAEPPETP